MVSPASARYGDGSASSGQPELKFGWTLQALLLGAGFDEVPARLSALPRASSHRNREQVSTDTGSLQVPGQGRQAGAAPAAEGKGKGALLLTSLSPHGLWHLLGLVAWVPTAMPAAENSSVLGRIWLKSLPLPQWSPGRQTPYVSLWRNARRGPLGQCWR